MRHTPLVLLADDCELRRDGCRLALEGAGYTVLEADDGRSVLRLARRHVPDLIVVELDIPALDGWQTARVLTRDPRTAEIPVIALADRGPERPEALAATGFSAYAGAPLSRAGLVELVERTLERGEAPAARPGRRGGLHRAPR